MNSVEEVKLNEIGKKTKNQIIFEILSNLNKKYTIVMFILYMVIFCLGVIIYVLGKQNGVF